MQTRFETILVIGGGLIGSSVARAAKAYTDTRKIFIVDESPSICSKLIELDIADSVSENKTDDYVTQADLIILCVPPAQMREVAIEIIPNMKAGAVLSDVGSVKRRMMDEITPYLRPDIGFVPGHPIAGSEYSGPEAGFADMFQNRWCILSPHVPDQDAVRDVAGFWKLLGSEVAIMSAERHDIVMATTSHVPHLIAYALVGTAVDMETVTRNEVVKFSAGGFRDFTRIAASDPVMWRDVFLNNHESVLEVVDRFIEELTTLKQVIHLQDGEKLLQSFRKTRIVRHKIIDAKQDSAAPNFGRDE